MHFLRVRIQTPFSTALLIQETHDSVFPFMQSNWDESYCGIKAMALKSESIAYSGLPVTREWYPFSNRVYQSVKRCE